MTSFKPFTGCTVYAVLLLIAVSHEVFAYVAPPMEIIDSKVSPDCVLIRAWELNYPDNSDESSTAIKIQNACGYWLRIKSIKIKTNEAEEQKPLDDVSGFIEGIVGQRQQFRWILFKAQGQECSSDFLKESDDIISCSGIALKSNEQITIRMERDTFYFMSGEPNLSISGHFINPRSP